MPLDSGDKNLVAESDAREPSIKTVVLDFMRANKAKMAGYLFFSLATPISNILMPHLYGTMISVINETHTIGPPLLKRFGAIILLWLLVQSFWLGSSALDATFIPELKSHIRKYIVEQVLVNFKQDYTEEETISIIADIIKLPDYVEQVWNHTRNNLLPMILLFTFAIAYFTWANPILGATSIVAVGTFLSLAWKVSTQCVPKWVEMNEYYKDICSNISDCLGNLLNVYTSNQDAHELAKIKALEQLFVEKHSGTINCTGNVRVLLNTSYIILFCGINLVAFWLFSRGKLALDNLVTVLVITLELILKMSSFVTSIDKIFYELTTIQGIQDSIDALTRRKKAPSANTNTQFIAGDIVVDSISINYKGRQVLDNFSTVFKEGTRTAIVGEIGSGKTSLINAICRLVPYTGTISIGGVDTKSMSIETLRTNLQYVPQNPKLFNTTIYENISYGNGVSKAAVYEALSKYGLQELDLDRKVGKFGQHLSGGQRQITLLLRCLFSPAAIIVLDEPTSALDYSTKKYIFSILSDLFVGKTVLIVSHDPEMHAFVNQTLTLTAAESSSGK